MIGFKRSACFVALATGALGAPPALAQVTLERVSVNSAEQQGNGDSFTAEISRSGRFVAFSSNADNIVPGDINRADDVFVRDRVAGTTSLVTPRIDQSSARGVTSPSGISDDGRFVAFGSCADDIVAGDTNEHCDVFLRDRSSNTTTLVSAGLGGQPANGENGGGSISASGRYLSFTSRASNLVAGDTNNKIDIFVWDRVTRSTIRVNLTAAGREVGRDSFSSVISADGQFVLFTSLAPGLVAHDDNDLPDVFLRDLRTRRNRLVNLSSAGEQARGGLGFAAFSLALSADNRFALFSTDADNLVPGDTNDADDVFVRNLATGTTSRVSVSSAGVQGNSISEAGFISANGRYVAFRSAASNLVPGDTNDESDAFLRDRQAGTTVRLSVGPGGQEGEESSYPTGISGDGRLVAFTSGAGNFVPGDTNGLNDIFVAKIGEAGP